MVIPPPVLWMHTAEVILLLRYILCGVCTACTAPSGTPTYRGTACTAPHVHTYCLSGLPLPMAKPRVPSGPLLLCMDPPTAPGTPGAPVDGTAGAAAASAPLPGATGAAAPDQDGLLLPAPPPPACGGGSPGGGGGGDASSGTAAEPGARPG